MYPLSSFSFPTFSSRTPKAINCYVKTHDRLIIVTSVFAKKKCKLKAERQSAILHHLRQTAFFLRSPLKQSLVFLPNEQSLVFPCSPKLPSVYFLSSRRAVGLPTRSPPPVLQHSPYQRLWLLPFELNTTVSTLLSLVVRPPLFVIPVFLFLAMNSC